MGSIEIVTKQDLEYFKKELVSEFKILFESYKQQKQPPVEGYKTSHVRKILSCSVNKLVSLRISGKIRIKKIGGTLYYNKEDVHRLVNEGF